MNDYKELIERLVLPKQWQNNGARRNANERT